MARVPGWLMAGVVAGSMGLAAAGAPATAPASQPASAPSAPSAPSAAQGPFPMQLQQMTRSLRLSQEQRGKLRDQIDAMNKELETVRLAEVQKSKDAIAVIESKDGAERDKLRQQLEADQKKASDNYQNLIATHQAAINAGLSADQRLAWETFKLNHAIQPKLGFEVTDSQRKQIRQLVDAAAKELVEAKDSAAVLSINGKLVRELVTKVLTEEQAARLFNAGPPPIWGLGQVPGPKATPIDRNLP